MDVTEEDLQNLYTWVRPSGTLSASSAVLSVPAVWTDLSLYCCSQVDEIPLSRPKRNIARDFADGGEASWLAAVMLACISGA